MALNRTGIPVLVMLSVLLASCSAVAGHDLSDRDLSMNGTNLSNTSVPDKYRSTPEPARVAITLPATLLAGPKGEMVAGPRSIGFDLVPLLVFAVVVLVLVAGLVWYIRKHEPGIDQDDDTEDGDG